MVDMSYYLLLGATLGITAGLTPGALFTLVISETLKYGLKEGIKVAIAPLLTDVPVIILSFLFFSRFSNFDVVLGLISIVGSFVLAYYGYETFRIKDLKVDLKDVKPASIKKGVVTNYLNPHLYIFYFTIGGPTMARALQANIYSPILFISSFMLVLVASKIGLALAASKSKEFLKSRHYIHALRFLGIVLILFSAMFFIDGLKFLGII